MTINLIHIDDVFFSLLMSEVNAEEAFTFVDHRQVMDTKKKYRRDFYIFT